MKIFKTSLWINTYENSFWQIRNTKTLEFIANKFNKDYIIIIIHH